MDLDEYLWRNKITLDKCKQEVGLSQAALCSLKRRKTSPSLLSALKLFEFSKGKITLEELLTHKHLEEYKKWQDARKTFDSCKSEIPKSWKLNTPIAELDSDPEFQKFKDSYGSQIIS